MQACALNLFASRIIAINIAAFSYNNYKLKATKSDLIDNI
jgi:hypothetical protein